MIRRALHERMLHDSFAQAAATYDAAAVLAQEVGRRMAQRLEYVKIAPRCLADIGCATGDGVRELSRRYPAALPIAVDYARPMLQAARRRTGLFDRIAGRVPRPLNADVNRLPLKSGSLGLAWSNLMLHWLDDPKPAFAELHRVLETGGLLTFAMLGPDTLREVRQACADCGIAPPLRQFADMHDIGDLLVATGFADPVMDMEMVTLTYRNPRGLLRDQRHLGVRDALFGKLSWREWRRVLARWVASRGAGAAVPCSFEIVYGHAWRAEPKKTADGHSIVRFAPR